MSTDLESRLEDHLRRSAATAPAPMLRLTEIDARAAQRKRRRSAARGVLAIGVAVGVGAAVMAMRDPQSTEPAGPTEAPLTRFEAAQPRAVQRPTSSPGRSLSNSPMVNRSASPSSATAVLRRLRPSRPSVQLRRPTATGRAARRSLWSFLSMP